MPSLGDVFGQIIPGAILQAIGSPEQQRAMAEKAATEAEAKRRWEAEYGLRKSEVETRLAELIRQMRDREEQKKALGGAADILVRPIPVEIQQAMKTPAATPGTPDYGVGEEAAAYPPERFRGLLPPTPERRALAGLVRSGAPIPEPLARLLGMQKPELMNLAPGHVVYDPITGQPKFTAPTTEKPTEYNLLDGSRWRVHADGRREMVSPPIKTAQPLTPEASAAIYAGVEPGKLPTPEQTIKMNEYLGQRVGARTEGSIEAQFKHRDQLAELQALKRRATKQVDVSFLPMEVQIRTQQELNVLTDPENVKKTAEKIYQEQRARTAAQPTPENDKQVLALLQTTRTAIQEIRTRFTPQEREQYVGIFRNPILRAAQIARGDPRFAEFQAIMGRIKKSAFDDGGKQLTPFEFSVVAQYVPQGNENSWADFEAKLAVAAELTDFLKDMRLELATMSKRELQQRGLPTPTFTPGGKPPVRGGVGGALPDPLGIRGR